MPYLFPLVLLAIPGCGLYGRSHSACEVVHYDFIMRNNLSLRIYLHQPVLKLGHCEISTLIFAPPSPAILYLCGNESKIVSI